MAAQKLAYTNFQIKLRVDKTQVNGSTATLEATEGASLPMSIDGKATEHNYSYSQKHLFTFVLENNQWILSSDKRLDNNEEAATEPPERLNPDAPPPTPVPPNAVPTVPGADPDLKKASLFKPELVASASLNNLGILRDADNNRTAPHIDRTPGIKPLLLAALSNVNKQEIVNYAHVYAGENLYDPHCGCVRKYNPKYRRFDGQGIGGDCTNFVSQALRWGGWADYLPQGWAFKADPSVWAYGDVNQTHTWSVASYFYDFVNNHVSSNGYHRAYFASTFGTLEPGDIILIKFAGFSTITHSLIVTHKNPTSTSGLAGNYELRVTYHSTDTLDRSFTDFYNSSPGATYYAWRVRTSY